MYIYLTEKGFAVAETLTFVSLQLSLPYSEFSPPIIVLPFSTDLTGAPKIISIDVLA